MHATSQFVKITDNLHTILGFCVRKKYSTSRGEHIEISNIAKFGPLGLVVNCYKILKTILVPQILGKLITIGFSIIRGIYYHIWAKNSNNFRPHAIQMFNSNSKMITV